MVYICYHSLVILLRFPCTWILQHNINFCIIIPPNIQKRVNCCTATFLTTCNCDGGGGSYIDYYALVINCILALRLARARRELTYTARGKHRARFIINHCVWPQLVHVTHTHRLKTDFYRKILKIDHTRKSCAHIVEYPRRVLFYYFIEPRVRSHATAVNENMKYEYGQKYLIQ